MQMNFDGDMISVDIGQTRCSDIYFITGCRTSLPATGRLVIAESEKTGSAFSRIKRETNVLYVHISG
jgi:hypothetical protein